MIDAINKRLAEIMTEGFGHEVIFVVQQEQDEYEQTQRRGLQVNLDGFLSQRKVTPLTFVGISSIANDPQRTGNLIAKTHYKLLDAMRQKYGLKKITAAKIQYEFRTYCAKGEDTMNLFRSIFFLNREIDVSMSYQDIGEVIKVKSLLQSVTPPTITLKFGRTKYYTIGGVVDVDGWIIESEIAPAIQAIDINYYDWNGNLLE